ncbi:MAG: hypothetical protein RL701_5682 [Pseudomonadota bacterium]
MRLRAWSRANSKTRCPLRMFVPSHEATRRSRLLLGPHGRATTKKQLQSCIVTTAPRRAPYPPAFRVREALRAAHQNAAPFIDLATGHNPYAAPEHIVRTLRDALTTRYPDPDAQAACASVAERFGLQPNQVLLGHGATDLAFSCVRALVTSPCVWLAIDPSFDPISMAARAAGARVTRWRSVERTGHRVDLEQVAELMRLEQPRVVSLSAPGSPTGSSVPMAELQQLAQQFPDTYFVVNQSGLSLSDDHTDLERPPLRNTLLLRSLTHDFALPGVRAGYALAAPTLIAEIAATRPPFCASAAAQALVQQAMQAQQFLADSRSQLQADRLRLAGVLAALGLVYTPSVAPFLLVRIARAEDFARELFETQQVAVCDATASGLPDHVRISALREEHVAQTQTALERVLERRGLVRGREP